MKVVLYVEILKCLKIIVQKINNSVINKQMKLPGSQTLFTKNYIMYYNSNNFE